MPFDVKDGKKVDFVVNIYGKLLFKLRLKIKLITQRDKPIGFRADMAKL